MQYPIVRLDIWWTLLFIFLFLAVTSQAKAASVEVVAVQEGATTRTVEVVRGDVPETRRGSWAFNAPAESRYQILPGTGGTLQLFDRQTQRLGKCFKVNTFDLGSESMSIKCRWRPASAR